MVGTNRGVGGRSMNESVCVDISISGTSCVSSSRYVSVCTTMCRLPDTGSGVPGGLMGPVLRSVFFVASMIGSDGRICGA